MYKLNNTPFGLAIGRYISNDKWGLKNDELIILNAYKNGQFDFRILVSKGQHGYTKSAT